MKKTSDQWAEEKGIELGKDILDPDGWDRQNFDFSFYEEKIPYREFMSRLKSSTCKFAFENNMVKIGNIIVTNS